MQYNIKIFDIENAKNKQLSLSIEDFIEGIDLKEPIKADLLLESLGDFIKISGEINGVAVLVCDLCLEKFDYTINLDIEELYAKNSLCSEYAKETELKEDQFIIDLQGSDEIDILDVLYQSVILDFPNKKVCGINCKGGDIFIREEDSEAQIDPRMAIFKDIKIEQK